MPGSSLDEAHKTLASELEILLNHVNKDSREWCKAKAIKKQLKLKKPKNIVNAMIWEKHQENILKVTVESKINENVNKRKIEDVARNATSAVAKACYAPNGCEIPKRPRTNYKNLGDHKQQPRTPERNIAWRDEKESSLYDTFPVHIHKIPEPNPFIVGNQNDHDINEKDDEFNAELTIVGGKSIDWIISGINIREKLTKYQLDANLSKANPEYYDIVFFNLNDEDGFLGTLDKGIVAQMRKEIKRAKGFVLHFVKHMVELIDDVNLFNDSMSEGTYIVNVLAPILGYFFNKKKKDWLVSYGETCLKAFATDINSNKKDDERRSSGKKIDTIISMREEDKEISVIEVSGPPTKNDWTHFTGDRMKIMKMLKTLMNQFAKLNPSSDIALIRLYGLQVYLNELTIYEFQLRYSEIYTIEAIFTFSLPKTWADMAKADKAIIGLLKYERLLSESSKTIRDFLWSSGGEAEAIKMATRMIHTPKSTEKAKNIKSTKKMKKKN
ncbi:unnamed protein product [Rhizophagus irregularis]|uniref:Uncharacterized protein n=1 Tax=Rhizophagus irregularis TaxID=588596 RepID=A0A915YSV3_9GLOM|nr:unnamed protein product [Rhizophagus irregularis]CAB5325926.1 unnamed protein product [Rhizophagus irregularis]